MSQGDHQFLWLLLSDRFLIDIRALKPPEKKKKRKRMNELNGAGEGNLLNY